MRFLTKKHSQNLYNNFVKHKQNTSTRYGKKVFVYVMNLNNR